MMIDEQREMRAELVVQVSVYILSMEPLVTPPGRLRHRTVPSISR